MGKREVYAEMLADTLDLTIGYSSSAGPYSNSRLICEPCITRLRDACDFKRQVQECEKTFMQQLNPENIPSVDVVVQPLETTVKVEAVKSEVPVSDDDGLSDVDFGVATADDDDDDDDDELDNEPLTKLASKVPKKEKDMVDLIDLADNRKATEKRKSSAKSKASPAKKAKTAAKVNEPVASASTASASKVEKKKKGPTTSFHGNTTALPNRRPIEPPNVVPRENAKLILKYSTAFPFKNTNNNFSCTFCVEQFLEPVSWRIHMNKNHKCYNFYHVFHRQKCVKVDILDLSCRICLRKLNGLEDLLLHLKNDHNMAVNMDKPLGVIPFKLDENNWRCVFCNEKFLYYKYLRDHTIKHINNFICDACGSGFLVANDLRQHVEAAHTSKKFECSKCGVVFESLKDCEKHKRTAHKHIYKCYVCKDRPVFKNWDHRYRHYVDVHNSELRVYKCNICEEDFITRTARYNHALKYHRKKNFICDVCEEAFMTNSQLKNHAVKHSDERPFKCSVCTKDFNRKKALTLHMRIHNNDRRFMCQECGQAFVQGTSLKLHVKTHHPILVSK